MSLSIPLHASTREQATTDERSQSDVQPSSRSLQAGASEWIVAAGLGWGVPVFRSSGQERLLLPSLSWGRVLTSAQGPGHVRGRFTWAVAVTPLFVQFEPENAYGIGVSPLVWRWNFDTSGRVAPYAELGGGGLWTTTDVPRETARANYVLHVAVAARVRGPGGPATIVGYRFEHISNGNRAPRNPSVNAHVLLLGWSFVKPPR